MFEDELMGRNKNKRKQTKVKKTVPDEPQDQFIDDMLDRYSTEHSPLKKKKKNTQC